jgi:hypothetical protein
MTEAGKISLILNELFLLCCKAISADLHARRHHGVQFAFAGFDGPSAGRMDARGKFGPKG